jgi:hypothetical protein
MKRIYVSGPYTKGNQAINVRNSILACDQLLDIGLFAFCPHLTHFWDMLKPRSWEEWMAYDLIWLPTCDAVLRLPGESKGADIEVIRAKELGMPVFYGIEEVLKAHEQGQGDNNNKRN